MILRTHQTGALAALLTILTSQIIAGMSVITLFSVLVANAIGALIPDMDQASNRLWDILPGGHIIGRIFKKLFMGHRSLSHSLLGGFLFYKLILWLIPKLLNSNYIAIDSVIFALLVGYGSHLMLDGLTEEGLPLLFPVGWKFGLPPWKRLRANTGGWVEKWIIFPVLVILVILMAIRRILNQ